MATHSSILAWRIPMDRGAWWATVHRVTNSWAGLKRVSKHVDTLGQWPRESGEPVSFLGETKKASYVSENLVVFCKPGPVLRNVERSSKRTTAWDALL